MLNAIETAEVTVNGGTTWVQAAQLEWFTVSWLEKVDGVWRRKPGSNLIDVGSIDHLQSADNPRVSPRVSNRRGTAAVSGRGFRVRVSAAV
jgi:hypothetical protein